jgi:hypothetical protein
LFQKGEFEFFVDYEASSLSCWLVFDPRKIRCKAFTNAIRLAHPGKQIARHLRLAVAPAYRFQHIAYALIIQKVGTAIDLFCKAKTRIVEITLSILMIKIDGETTKLACSLFDNFPCLRTPPILVSMMPLS